MGNAVRHTKGPAALRVRRSGGTLRIGAWDADPEPPATPKALHEAAESEDGRGLGLVRTCADAWGWYPLTRNGNRSKFVWCGLAVADDLTGPGHGEGALRAARGSPQRPLAVAGVRS